jgi:Flp pilus assembly protein TadD
MGDQALCLLDAGKYDEAKAKLDQLAAITPLDWRVALGLAALHDHNGETDMAKDSWLAALDRAPNEEIRAAIKAKMPASAAAELKS